MVPDGVLDKGPGWSTGYWSRMEYWVMVPDGVLVNGPQVPCQPENKTGGQYREQFTWYNLHFLTCDKYVKYICINV